MLLEIRTHGDFPKFETILRAIIGPGMESRSLIDLCSCQAPVTQRLPFLERVHVDVMPQSYPNFVQADVLGEHGIFARQYSVSMCLDGIEHIHKPQGFRLLERMEAISEKQIVFTPLDAWMLDETATNPEAHKCVWGPADVPSWACITAPVWHPTLGIGAFFFWKCPDIEADFARVKQELSHHPLNQV